MATTIQINEYGLEVLTEKIAKLAKAAAKLNLSPVTLSVVAESAVAVKGEDGVETGETYRVYTVEVTGEDVQIAGWAFAATLDNQDGGTMIRKSPKFESAIPVRYYESSTACDHCQRERARKYVYLLYRAEDGAWIQVGRSCLKDFLGHGNAEAVARLYEEIQDMLGGIAEDSDSGESMTGYSPRLATELRTAVFMAHCAAMIRTHGYKTKAAAEAIQGVSTKEAALFNIEYLKRRRNEAVSPTDEDRAQAEEVINWAHAAFVAKPIAERTDYEHNMAITFTGDSLNRRQLGYAASAFGAWAKAKELEIIRRKEAATSEYVGQEGQKVEGLSVEVTRVIELDGRFGSTYIVKMITPEGNQIVWKTGSWEPKAGTKATIKGTIKKQDEYRGVKQTELTRCKVTVIEG